MWNLYLLYPDLTGVYPTDDRLEGFDHVRLRLADVPGRCDESVMDWKCTEAIIIRCSKRPKYQLAVDAHQAHSGIRTKRIADRLVTLFDSGQKLRGIGAARPNAIGKRIDRRASIRGVHGNVEPSFDVIPGKLIDVIWVADEI
jgi:hypothetical protein